MVVLPPCKYLLYYHLFDVSDPNIRRVHQYLEYEQQTMLIGLSGRRHVLCEATYGYQSASSWLLCSSGTS